MFLFIGELLAFAAAVAEFLLIAGGAGTVSACLTVIGEGAGVGILALVGGAHKITLLFVRIDLLDSGPMCQSASQRPEAPQGRTRPLEVTGRPISWESTFPLNFFSSVESI